MDENESLNRQNKKFSTVLDKEIGHTQESIREVEHYYRECRQTMDHAFHDLRKAQSIYENTHKITYNISCDYDFIEVRND